jgi:hypothetical protein
MVSTVYGIANSMTFRFKMVMVWALTGAASMLLAMISLRWWEYSGGLRLVMWCNSSRRSLWCRTAWSTCFQSFVDAFQMEIESP